MRHEVPSRTLLWAGYGVAALALAWVLTGNATLGKALALAGGLYTAACLAMPHRMPRVELDGARRIPPAVTRWSNRILGLLGVPLWIAAWRGHVPRIPSGLVIPAVIGIAVAIAAQVLAPERRGGTGGRPDATA